MTVGARENLILLEPEKKKEEDLGRKEEEEEEEEEELSPQAEDVVTIRPVLGDQRKEDKVIWRFVSL